MSSLDAILEHAPGRFIDLIAPRPLLMILARNDAVVPRIQYAPPSPAPENPSTFWKSKAVTMRSTTEQAQTRRPEPRHNGHRAFGERENVIAHLIAAEVRSMSLPGKQ